MRFVNRHCKDCTFKVNIGHPTLRLIILKTFFRGFILKCLYLTNLFGHLRFNMVLNEPSFFFLVNIVDTKSLFCLSHLMMNPFCESSSISAFEMRFSYSLLGNFGEHIMFSLSIKSILRPFLLMSRIILSLVIFSQSG